MDKSTEPTSLSEPSLAVGTLARGLKVLSYVIRNGPSTNGEIATALRLPKATVHRLVQVLTDQGFLVELDSRSYIVGVPFILAQEQLQNNTLGLFKPLLESVATRSGEAANLAVLNGNMALYLSSVRARHLLGTFTNPGNKVPLHATGVGKALLASLGEQAPRQLIPSLSLERYSKATITSAEGLLDEILKIGNTGLAFDNEEYTPGVRCVATWIRLGKVSFGISISGPVQRIDRDRMKELSEILKDSSTNFCRRVHGAVSHWTDSDQFS